MKSLILTFISAAAFLSVSYSQVTPEWEQRYNGPGNGIDLAFSIVVDNQGNVYVTGNSVGETSDNDITTIKYSASGVQEWIQRYNGPSNALDVINGTNAIAVDGSGNVYVAGCSETGATNYIDYAVIKYNSAGVQQWVQYYNGPGNSYDAPSGIALDAADNVYVTGRSESISAGADYTTIKFNSDGVQQWIETYNGAGNSYDAANAISLDNDGNVYITGYCSGAGSGDCATIKYNTDGVQQWAEIYDGPENGGDYENAIAVDGSGNVVVTGGTAGSGTYNDYLTMKYNSSGQQQWTATYSSAGSNFDEARSIALDGVGNVYITGVLVYSEGGTTDNYGTVKYNSSGVEQWSQVYNGPAGLADEAYSIAVDADGNSYVIGYYDGWGNQNIGIVKYNSDGVQQWMQSYDGPASDNDNGFDIVVDSENNFYISGGSVGIGTTMDYVVVKYSQIIPVELTSFTADADKGEVELRWQTATETNNKGFEVERSQESGAGTRNWENIGYVQGYGTTTEPKTYSFNDNNVVSGIYTYRLKQIDFDGTCKYSNEIEVSVNLPLQYSLSQNFPNPFNPITTIEFSLPENVNNARLTIYNTLGEKVAELVNQTLEAGKHRYNWDAANAATGLYIYELRSDNFIAVKKMILLK